MITNKNRRKYDNKQEEKKVQEKQEQKKLWTQTRTEEVMKTNKKRRSYEN